MAAHRKRKRAAPIAPPPPVRSRVVERPVRRLPGCLFVVTALVAGVIALYWGYFEYVGALAPPESVARRIPPSSTKIYDRNGVFLYEIFDPQGGRRTIVPLSKIPQSLIDATIATEDADFYTNPGVSFRGAIRALLNNARAGEVVEGGSGITQQLVKNVIVPAEHWSGRTVDQKFREAMISFELTRRYSKDQILEWYLNEVSYGNLSFGIEAAAQNYFGKPAEKLSLAESAFLAGLPQAPARYSPYTDLNEAIARQDDVLALMVRHGKITQDQKDAALAEPLRFRPPVFPIVAPHFVTYVRERLEATYGRRLVEQGGFTVQTTLDLELQRKAERAVADGVKSLSGIGATNGALVAIDPKTGELLAMVGSADFWNTNIQGQVNVAVSPRQPGSSFKPISYLAAFIKGYSPNTTVWDTPASYPDGVNGRYVPVNADGKYRGPIRARDALAQSLNPPAVATLQYAGLDNVIDLAHRLGITDLRQRNRYGLSLTLGGGEVKLLDMAYVYSVLANNGEQVGSSVPEFRRIEGMRVLEPTVILSVKDPWGNEIEEHRTPRRERITPEDHTYLITNVLSDNNARAPMFGLNSPLSLGNRPAAVKTGTTNDFRDFWTIGYTPQLVAAVWVGNTDGRPMKFSYSSVTAAPIWNAFMTSALQGKPIEQFRVPSGIVRAPVCLPSVEPWPQYWCASANEVFAASRAPKVIDDRAALLSARPPTLTPTPAPTRSPATPTATPGRVGTAAPIPTSTPR